MTLRATSRVLALPRSTAQAGGRTTPPRAPRTLPDGALADWKMLTSDLVERDAWHPRLAGVVEALAVLLLRLRQAQQRITDDGIAVTNARGDTVAHPLLTSVTAMLGRVAQLANTLGIALDKAPPSPAPKARSGKSAGEADPWA
jgi:P27 family predicted phage terminase small subunit